MNSFPQCQPIGSLGPHLDAWEDLFTEPGAGLDIATNQLVVVFKEKLPASISIDLLDHPEVRTYEDILMFCSRRTDHRTEHDLCEQAKKQILARTCINAVPVAGQQLSEPSALGSQADQLPPANGWRLEQACAGNVQVMISPRVSAMMKDNGNHGRDPSPTGGRGTRDTRKSKVASHLRSRFSRTMRRTSNKKRPASTHKG